VPCCGGGGCCRRCRWLSRWQLAVQGLPHGPFVVLTLACVSLHLIALCSITPALLEIDAARGTRCASFSPRTANRTSGRQQAQAQGLPAAVNGSWPRTG